MTDERFLVPADFDPQTRLEQAWTVSDEEPLEVRLRFHDAAAAARARENRWHPSQRELPGERHLDLAFTVGGLTEITPWVLSWGEAVEVVEPAELRARVAAVARAMAARYGGQGRG